MMEIKKYGEGEVYLEGFYTVVELEEFIEALRRTNDHACEIMTAQCAAVVDLVKGREE